jgi:hypothetical protein
VRASPTAAAKNYAAGLGYHKMWGSRRKSKGIIPIVENMLPDSPLHVNDTYIREIALKAIFGEAGDDYEGI